MTIADQIENCFDTIQGVAGISVTYTREDRAVTLIACPGTTDYETEVGDIIESVQSRDFIIKASDLKFGGTPVVPARGDTIRETISGISVTYAVAAPGGAKHFEFTDPYRRVIRVHTKQVTES